MSKKGGKSTSEAKKQAAKENWKKAVSVLSRKNDKPSGSRGEQPNQTPNANE